MKEIEFPLLKTCEKLDELFPNWRTKNILIHYDNEDLSFFIKLSEDSGRNALIRYIAPTFQELWDMLPQSIELNTKYWFKLDKEDVSYFSYNDWTYFGQTTIKKDHVVEAMAQLLIKLKKKKLI